MKPQFNSSDEGLRNTGQCFSRNLWLTELLQKSTSSNERLKLTTSFHCFQEKPISSTTAQVVWPCLPPLTWTHASQQGRSIDTIHKRRYTSKNKTPLSQAKQGKIPFHNQNCSQQDRWLNLQIDLVQNEHIFKSDKPNGITQSCFPKNPMKLKNNQSWLKESSTYLIWAG